MAILIYRSTRISQHLLLTTGGLRWCKVLLPACFCRPPLAHLDWGENAGVLLSSYRQCCLCTDTVTKITYPAWLIAALRGLSRSLSVQADLI